MKRAKHKLPIGSGRMDQKKLGVVGCPAKFSKNTEFQAFEDGALSSRAQPEGSEPLRRESRAAPAARGPLQYILSEAASHARP